MKFQISQQIFERFPQLNIGVVVAREIDNRGIDDEVMRLIRDREKEICNGFELETLSDTPQIDSWRKAYSSFGAKPKKYKCSVENLYRIILSDIELRHINKLVDIYNYISIKHLIPIGGDDIDHVDGDIALRIASGDETFVELNSKEAKNPRPGEIIYTDDKEVLCRRWNWRECDKSKMTENTKNVILVTEGLPPVRQEDVKKIISELGDLIIRHCGGRIERFMLNTSNSSIKIPD